MSRFHNRNFELLEPYEGKLSRTVLRGERGSNASDLPDKKYYDALKKVHNLVKSARKVQQTILMIGDISDIYMTSYQRMLSDPYFSIEELAAIAEGYAILLTEASNVLSDLSTIVNENGLSVDDKGRLDVVDKCYDRVYEYRALTRYYTDKNIGVSWLRAKKKNDTDRIMALYGNPTDRYW